MAGATAKQRAEGLVWYPWAGKAMQDVAEVHGYPRKVGPAVLAVLSPQMPFKRNVALAIKALQNGHATGHTGANCDKADRIMAGAPIRENLGKASKVPNFFANLMGDHSRVTVDVQAIKPLGMPFQTADGAFYDYVAGVYAEAAKVLGLTPAACQAIAWGVVRGNGDILTSLVDLACPYCAWM